MWTAKERLVLRVAPTTVEHELSDAADRAVFKHSGNFLAVDKCLVILAKCSVLSKTGELDFFAYVLM